MSPSFLWVKFSSLRTPQKASNNSLNYVKKLKPTLIACEYTGGLEQPLLIACAESGLPIAVVNPKQVRDFARAIGKHAKTDAIDATVLAEFASRIQPVLRSLQASRFVRSKGS
jgi:transposase